MPLPIQGEPALHEVMHAAFDLQAARAPNAIALVRGTEALTYDQLRRLANRVAHALRAHGVGPGTHVGIFLERSPEAVTAILGVLKAGSAYVPLDPSLPRARLAFMLEAAGVTVTITRSALRERLPAASTLCVDTDLPPPEAGFEADPPPLGEAESPAYVMYTSGSTGQPKGVLVPHRAIHRLAVGTNYITVTPSDRVLHAAPLVFDASTFEIWCALANGARLVILSEQELLSPRIFAEHVRKAGITIAFLTTALFNQIAREVPESFSSLSYLLFGGEACDPRTARQVLAQAAPRHLLHVYGPTENTTFSTFHLVRGVPEGAATVPIGRAISGTQLHVLDGDLRRAAPGTEGELYLGGSGLALGYLNQPAATAERFIPNPFPEEAGAVLYRTGDRVRLLPDGALEFIGRMDQQIKLLGHRIEPAEIEAALLQHPAVAEAVVTAREDTSGDRQLVAYFTSRQGEPCSPSELRRTLQESLPSYMVPAAFIPLPEMPLSPNGKIDRQALPALSGTRPALQTRYTAPRTPTEHALVSIWSELLGITPIGIHDDFLELGGDSLRAVRIVARVREVLGAQLPIRSLLESTTVAALAARIDADSEDLIAGPLPPPLLPARIEGPVPLSFAQRRLWFLHELVPTSAAYALPIAIHLGGPLDRTALEQGVLELLARHDALRTTVALQGDTAVQAVGPMEPLPLPVTHLAALSAPEREQALRALARSEASTPFDLKRGPLLRARLVCLGPGEHVLLLVVHHIAADGWSFGVLMRELAALHEAFAAGAPSPLPPLPVNYADYTLWQRNWLAGEALSRELEYWRHELSGAPDVPTLPTDRPRPATPTHRGEQVRFMLPTETVEALSRLGQASGSTPFMVYLAAFALLLHRDTRDTDFVVGSPFAGRPLGELEGLVGFFVNTLPLRIRLDRGLTFRQLLQHVRERALAAFAHQAIPFERLVEELRPLRAADQQPLFQVMFALQSPPADVHTPSGLRLRFEELESGAAPFDLFWQLWERPSGMEGSIVYASDLFDAATVTRMRDDYLRLLAAIAAAPDAHLAELVLLDDVERSTEASLRETELRLLASPLVNDCVVRMRRAEGGRRERIAYVASADPAALGRLGPGLGLPPDMAPNAVVRLSALPLDASGRLDEAALRKHEVMDEALSRRWEETLRAMPGVTEAIALIHEPRPALPLLHLSDLLSSAAAEPLAEPLWQAPGSTAPSAPRSSPPSHPPTLSDGGPLHIPEDEPRTLVDALLRTAAMPGNRGITYFEARGAPVFQSYAALLQEARAVLGGLLRRGLRPGSRAILQLDTLREHFTAFWGCLLGGITPVTVAIAPSYEASNGVASKLLGTWRLLQHPALLSSARLVQPLRDFLAPQAGAAEALILPFEELRQGPAATELASPEPLEVAFLQLTSGSTGVPKCIQETHQGIIHHIQATRRFNGYGAGDVTLNWLPVDHVVPILSCHLRDVYLGLPALQVRTELVLEEPLLWLDLLEQYRVTRTWSPNFGFKLVAGALARAVGRQWDLSRVKHFMNAGEQVTLPVVREFLERVRPFGVPSSAMQPAFGMAEVCTCMTYNNDFDPSSSIRWITKSSLGGVLSAAPPGALDAVPFIDLGPPVPGVQIRIAGAEGHVLSEGAIGRLQIKGTVVTPGYLHNDAANHESFVGEGWFNTGDLGFIEGGRLTLTGREKETIIIRGANFYCHELEDVAGSVPGVEPTFAAACAAADPRAGTEGLAIFFVPREASLEAHASTASAIRAALTSRLGVTPSYVVPLRKSDFPKTTSGKIQRTRLKRLLEQGHFAPLLKKLDLHTGNDNTLPDWFFQRIWVRKEHAPLAPPRTGRVVVFLDPLGLGERLAAELRATGRPCTLVEPGEGFARLGPERYRIAPREAASYRLLMEALTAGSEPLDALVHLLAYDDSELDPADAAALEQALGLSTYSLLFLAQALEATLASRPTQLLVVSNRTQPVTAREPLAPHKASALGLIHTLSQEMPWLDCRHVDLAPEDALEGARWVLRELSMTSREREIAYREGARHVARLQKVDMLSTEHRPPPLVPGGRYLISGGLGGIGLLVARHLLERYRAQLLLIGRGTLAAEAHEGSPRARAHQELVAAAGTPGRVTYEAVDAANLLDLREAVARAEARWGASLDGIIHLAGVLEERTLAEETEETFTQTLRPKVGGALSMARLASERPGTLFLGFSSVNATFGGFSSGAYASANRFVEHLALSLNRRGLEARCLSWSLWDEVGMSRGHAMKDSARARGYLTISPARGLASLMAALERSSAHLIVGLDLRTPRVAAVLAGEPQRQEQLHILYTGAPLAQAPRVSDRFGNWSTAAPRRTEGLPRDSSGAIDARALLAQVNNRSGRAREHIEPRNPTERTLAAIWRDVLGRHDLGAFDNFFDLGGHSLLVAQMRLRLQKAFGKEVPLVELFRHPTIAALATYLDAERAAVPRAAPEQAAPRASTGAIAVVGLACRVPGAADPDTFWDNLRAGVESIRRLSTEELVAAGVAPELLDNPRYVRARGGLDGVDLFDAGFFGMNPREAELTDPQHRLFLECAWEALESAGYAAPNPGGKIGVFAGAGPDGYLLHHLVPNRALLESLGAMSTQLGNDRDYLATRVSYKLDLRGPALTVQTACSTALVAVHLACRSLRERECDVALAGGVSIAFPLNTGYLYQPGHILSPDGHCRPFDAASRGTVGGDGAGVVALKRLEDAIHDRDPIHAVILGSAINNDGAAKVGFTAPGVEGQATVIAAAHAAAGVRASSISYVEAHGTGTELGDPLELAALTQAFQEDDQRQGRCAVGSVKSNVGHLNTAAGIAGLLKTTLALEHKAIPPSLHFTTPNPEIRFEDSPFYVCASLRTWERGEEPRRAGVSSFGFGGTNAHLVLEEAPEFARAPSPRPHQLFVLSARSPEALEVAARRLGSHLERHAHLNVADVAYTLALGRRHFDYRRALVCRGTSESLVPLSSGAGEPGVAATPHGVAFLFPGQGAQHAGMARELYQTEPTFRRHLEHCAGLFAPHLGLSLLDVLYGGADGADERLTRTAFAQPALFAVEYALARLWMDWGVRPTAMLGHSLGEYVAACLAGVFSLEDAVTLVATRGRLMQSVPPGAMLAVPLAEHELLPLLGSALSLAAVNEARSCVAAGPEEALAALERRLSLQGLQGRRLRTSHAFHSAMMDGILDTFRECLRAIPLKPPAIPYVSNASGTWVTPEQATDPESWVRQLRHTVRFHEGLRELAKPGHALLEVGPSRSLSALATQLSSSLPDGQQPLVAWSLPSPRGQGTETETLMSALGRLWASGVPVDWAAYHAHESRRKVTLPTYPFERKRYWVAPPLPAAVDEGRELEQAETRIRERLAIRPIDAYPGLTQMLEELCTSYLCRYLQSRGVEMRAGTVLSRTELKRRMGTVPGLDRLFEALIGILAEDGLVALSADEVRFLVDGGKLTSPGELRGRLQANHPGFEGLYQLLEHCVSHYPDTFTGRIHPISVLYPGGNSSFIAECERRTVQYRGERVYIELLAEALGRLVRASPGRELRILEVGGGRGLLTFPLLSALADADLKYCFTDLGKTFVDDARTEAQRLQLTAKMTFGLLDISQDPRPQGYEPQSFDVIVAFNVVHATRDVTETLRNLRTLLVPGGTLALVEMVRARRWDTMTWGLAEGWWYFDDAVRKGSPLLGLDAWESLLHREGFEHVAAWPRTGEERLRGDHGLVLARRALVEAPPRERRATVSPATHPRPPVAQPYVAPRTAMERQLAVICQELLGVAQVGVHDDFFELGADSLITLRLTERIRQELGREVPQHVAFRGATIERMARAIEGKPEEGPSNVLIPLQSGGSRPPLFFVHPAAGVVFPYVELARLLGPEQPFYGLQAAGLDGKGAPDKHIEDMAARYVAAIRTIDPEGPYYLGGFSFGCFVAFEMAQQLRRAGKEVALLALIDEPAPISGHRPSPFIMAKLLTAGMIRSSWPYFHDYLYLLYNSRERTQAEQAPNGGAPAALRSLLRFRPDLKRLESFLARSTMANYIPRDSRLLALQQPAMIPMFRMFMLHISETVRYQPKAYAGRVTLFKCTPLGGLNAKDPTCGWGLLAAGGVDVLEMPGEHLTMLRHPHVRVFAERLRDVLNSVRQKHGRGAISSAR